MVSADPSATLPAWVRELRADRRASVAIAEDVADAVRALGWGGVPAVVRRQLTRIVERADDAVPGVPVSVSAKLLDVTEPTARAWIERGVLRTIPGARPAAVTPRSLGEALAAVSIIRRGGQDERVLRRVLDALDDQRTRLELSDRIDELDSRVAIDPERIAEELFSERPSRSA
ncbi:MAG: hypothetical protein ACT4OS_07850 [Acidimicrobiales bacterium]